MICARRWMTSFTVLVLLSLPVGRSLASGPLDALHIARDQAGTPMPPFELETMDGQLIRSDNLKGRVVLLNFWATWCGPCKDEMPALARLEQHFSEEDFLVLTITTDRQSKAIQAFFKLLAVNFPVLLDVTGDVSQTYMVRALPLTVLVGKNGDIIGKAMGPRAWDSPDSVALIQTLTATSATP